MSVDKHIQSAIDVLVKAPASEQSNIAIGILTRALNVPEPEQASIKKSAVAQTDSKKRNAEKVQRYREKKKQLTQAAKNVEAAKAKD